MMHYPIWYTISSSAIVLSKEIRPRLSALKSSRKNDDLRSINQQVFAMHNGHTASSCELEPITGKSFGKIKLITRNSFAMWHTLRKRRWLSYFYYYTVISYTIRWMERTKPSARHQPAWVSFGEITICDCRFSRYRVNAADDIISFHSVSGPHSPKNPLGTAL